jgi:SAM-dependent methyltransferase
MIVNENKNLTTSISFAINQLPENLKDRIKSGISVLDLGCGNCNYWYDLYRTIGFNSITGIDMGGSQMFIDTELLVGKKNLTFATYDHYLYDCKKNWEIEPEIKKEDFELIFRKNFKSIDVYKHVDELVKNNEKYQLIILSSFLHLLDPEPDLIFKFELLRKLHLLLNPDGFVYLYGNDPMNKEENFVRPSRNQVIKVLNEVGFENVVQLSPGSLIYSLLFYKA